MKGVGVDFGVELRRRKLQQNMSHLLPIGVPKASRRVAHDLDELAVT